MPLGSAFRFFEGDNVMTTIEERAALASRGLKLVEVGDAD